MQIDIVNLKHEKTGTIELPEDIFGTEVKTALLWEQVKAQRASKRRGTHDTKTRADVSGGGAKPFKQKGTGRARQGSTRAPNQVGGGVEYRYDNHKAMMFQINYLQGNVYRSNFSETETATVTTFKKAPLDSFSGVLTLRYYM